MKIFGQTPAEIAEVLLSMAKAGETITVGGSGYTEEQCRAVVEEVWRQHADRGLSITEFRSVVGVLDPESLFHGKPVRHLPEVFHPTVDILLGS